MEPLSLLFLLKWLTSGGSPTPVITPGPTPILVPQGNTPAPQGQVFVPSGGAASVPQGQSASATPGPDTAKSVLPVPAGTPPFTGRGDPHWEPDIPPPPSVTSRAKELLDQLWATGLGSYVQELTNGRQITYLAEWHGAQNNLKGVTAFRLKGTGSSVSGASVYGYLYG
jgi:hypothetical protein